MDWITLENFRCFREEQTARLAPLTLLVGENSTGKTSFMAMIRALWDIAYRSQVPDFKEEPYDVGSFDEIAHRRGARGGQARTFDAGFDVVHGRRKGVNAKNTYYRFEVTFGNTFAGVTTTTPVPARRQLALGDTWVEDRLEADRIAFTIGTSRGSWRGEVPAGDMLLDLDGRWPHILYHLPYTLVGIDKTEKFYFAPIDDSPEFTSTDQENVRSLISYFALFPRHRRRPFAGVPVVRPFASAPVRSKPRRTYDPARTMTDPEGDYVPMYLANKYFQDKKEWENLKAQIERFGKAAGLLDEISINPLGRRGSDPFQIQVRKFGDRRMGPHHNLIDVGYGVSQVLPMIVELFRRDASPMLLLQQPEVHLHPRAQAALGSLFCQAAARNRRQLVVETHSDHLLDRVRMDVRDGKSGLKPEDVSLLYFERGELDVRIHSLQFDKEGNVLGAPPGYRRFFMEETQRFLRI